jgi:phospholipid/cholesterol/gamma-HCH transport system ATP-binding protein
MAQSASTPTIEVRGLTVVYRGHKVLEDIDLVVPRGSTYGLIGPAACGKSIFLRMLCGLLKPTRGEIWIDGVEVTKLREEELYPLRRKIGMLFQNNALFDYLNNGDNIGFPLEQEGGHSPEEIRERVSEALRKVSLPGIEPKFPNEISGGMKKRVGVARATITRPPIVFYDDPTAGLDPVTTSRIFEMIREIQEQQGTTSIVVSHELAAMKRVCHRFAMIFQGRLVYDGPPEGLDHHEHPAVRQFVTMSPDGPL